jgi:TPR repeat protein
MALATQPPPSQLGILFNDLERPYEHKNPKAIHNYGLVKTHVGVAAKAIELLQTAMHLGVPEARGALGRLLFNA